MNETDLPLLPTSVVGSYATPSWLITAIEEIDKGNYEFNNTISGKRF